MYWALGRIGRLHWAHVCAGVERLENAQSKGWDDWVCAAGICHSSHAPSPGHWRVACPSATVSRYRTRSDSAWRRQREIAHVCVATPAKSARALQPFAPPALRRRRCGVLLTAEALLRLGSAACGGLRLFRGASPRLVQRQAAAVLLLLGFFNAPLWPAPLPAGLQRGARGPVALGDVA